MTIRTSIRPFHLAAALSLVVSVPALAQSAACEPGKLAQKYPSLAGKTIKIGVDAQTPPYVMRDPKQFSNLIGFDADLARQVFDCAGIKYEFFVGGWSGLLPALNAKQIDVFWNNLYYTADRAKQVNFVTYMQAGTGALVAAGNPKKITGFDQLCGSTVAVGVGTVEEPQVRAEDVKCKAANKPGVTVMVFPDVAAGTRLVQSARADAMMYDLALIDSLVKDNPTVYARGFKVLSGLNIGVAVSKDATDLLNAVRDGLLVAQANKQQKAIFEKYTIDPDLQVTAEVKTR
jgi:polar amino acid transport system substrate-binding protein